MFAELFLGSTNNPNYIREINVRPIFIKNGHKATGKVDFPREDIELVL